MTYNEARVYLDEVSKYGSVLGLDMIRKLLEELGNPQDRLKFIHIAGTNGKGSVLAYISTVLSRAGFRTGRYLSPSMVSYLEKIQVDGKWIPEEEFAELVEEVQKAIARMETDGKAGPTVFEVETAVAFLYFRKMRCDYVVLEAGLGGAQDATNIVNTTAVAVFSTISRDHMGVLGDTLEEIAEEKAGILKPGCVAVSAAQAPQVRSVLEKRAARAGCRILFAQPGHAQVLEESWQGMVISYKGLEKFRIHLAGRCQILNVTVACEALWALQEEQITEDAMRRGLADTVWPGRFSCICQRPLFFLDGAHNEDAALRLRETMQMYFPRKRLIFIMGVFRDKEYEKIVEIMAPLADRIYTVNLPNACRTLDADVLKEAVERCWGWGGPGPDMAAGEAGFLEDPDLPDREKCAAKDRWMPGRQGRSVEAAGCVEKAVRLALDAAQEKDVILAFGSLSYLEQVARAVHVRQEDEEKSNDRS